MSKFNGRDSPDFYMEMMELGAQGLSLKECGEYHSVDDEDWAEWCENHKLTEVMLRRGKAQGLALAGKELIKQIQQGKINAIMFYLKTQGNFSEKQILELNSSEKHAPDPPPQVAGMDPTEAAKRYRAWIQKA